MPRRSAPGLVVGLGGSAGAFSSLLAFFRCVGHQTGAAYVVILHLAPDYESRAAQVLQGATRMPVTQVTGPMTLEANHVYVIAPGGTLEFQGDQLVPNVAAPPEQRRAPVDVFFRSLADAYGARAVAVVLSGTGANGSSGIKRVKEHGGLVLAQEPAEAEHAEMPRNALDTGLVDAVLPAADLPGRIEAWAQHVASPESPQVSQDDTDALREVLAILRLRTGQDFSNYKPGTVRRRVERRMNVRGVMSVSAYAHLLRDLPDEPTALMRDLLISVTNFFRDREAFAVLEQRVLPGVFDNRTAMDQVRAWVAGCATGEEAYSVAMLLAERAAASSDPPAVLVFATDLDEAAIAKARDGFYTDGDVSDVSEERLHRFFQRQGTGYRVRRDLREMVLFAHHNLLKDPAFSHLDLISCRNVLIYLNRRVQDRLLETFNCALRPGGFLILGTSEAPDGHSELFVPVDKRAHVYESRTVTTRPILSAPSAPAAVAQVRMTVPGLEPRPADRLLPAELHQRLLEQYAPPSIVLTEDHNVVHVSEHAGRYLRVSGGEPSRDVLKLVHPDLRVELRTALHQAMRERQPVSVSGVRLHEPTGNLRVTMNVRPVLREGDPARGFFLVLFEDTAAPVEHGEAVPLATTPESVAEQLEEELARVRGQLRGTVEQYESQVEEATATNEELQAMNEELRSSAEELETSREELQSVNEELTTVNQELKLKIEELGLTNNDFRNLMNSTDIGTIFLDRALRVKLTTPRAQDVFNLLPGDIGRPLSDITSRLVHEGLYEDVRTVLETLQTIEREVETRDRRWSLMRVLPYRTLDDRIDGIVITFQDITSRMRAEQQVRASEERMRLLIDSAVDYAIFTTTPDGRIDSWNAGAERLFGYTAEEIVGTSVTTLFTPEDCEANAFDDERRAALADDRVERARWHVRKNGTRLYCSSVTTRLGQRGDAGLAKICRDLTAEREWGLSLQQAHAELEDRVQRRTAELESEARQHAVAEERVSHLLRRVVTTQEDERKRIARDLHDELGQRLTALRLALQRHVQALAGTGTAVGEDLESAQRLAAAVDAELDYISWELRPSTLDDLGLAAALPQYVAEWSAHYKVATECRTEGYSGAPLLPPEGEVAFYRVAQEALNNVAKHAAAARVDVLLDRRIDAIVLVIEDDGVGFDTSDAAGNGFGLVSMRERAMLIGAELEIESEPGEGTTVFLRRRHDVAQRAGEIEALPEDEVPPATAGTPLSSP